MRLFERRAVREGGVEGLHIEGEMEGVEGVLGVWALWSATPGALGQRATSSQRCDAVGRAAALTNAALTARDWLTQT